MPGRRMVGRYAIDEVIGPFGCHALSNDPQRILFVFRAQQVYPGPQTLHPSSALIPYAGELEIIHGVAFGSESGAAPPSVGCCVSGCVSLA